MEPGSDIDISQTQDSPEIRWRLILGQDADPLDQAPPMNADQSGMDEVLEALYQDTQGGTGGPSMPSVTKWLGDIRTYFPTEVVQLLQKDAMDKLGLEKLLQEPELVESLVPDVKLVAQLVALSEMIPDQTRSTARMIVQKLADQLTRKLLPIFQEEVKGSLLRTTQNQHPSPKEMDWNRTILANLKHYQPEYKTIIPEKKIGFRRIKKGLKNVILLVDQSASMADSVVYAGIIAGILAKLPALNTQLVLFDTEITNVSEHLDDVVDLLFGVQLGGGTDIGQALHYAAQLIHSPKDTILFLISDLDEGTDTGEMIAQAHKLMQTGVTFYTLLSLTDQGEANWHAGHAKIFRQMGIPCLTADPNHFPQVLAESILKGNK